MDKEKNVPMNSLLFWSVSSVILVTLIVYFTTELERNSQKIMQSKMLYYPFMLEVERFSKQINKENPKEIPSNTTSDGEPQANKHTTMRTEDMSSNTPEQLRDFFSTGVFHREDPQPLPEAEEKIENPEKMEDVLYIWGNPDREPVPTLSERFLDAADSAAKSRERAAGRVANPFTTQKYSHLSSDGALSFSKGVKTHNIRDLLDGTWWEDHAEHVLLFSQTEEGIEELKKLWHVIEIQK